MKVMVKIFTCLPIHRFIYSKNQFSSTSDGFLHNILNIMVIRIILLKVVQAIQRSDIDLLGDEIFIDTCKKKHMAVVEFLLYEIKIALSAGIEKYILTNPQVAIWFNKRKLEKSLALNEASYPVVLIGHMKKHHQGRK